MIFLLDSTRLVAQLMEPKLHARLPKVGLEIFSSAGALYQRLTDVHDDAVIAILAPSRSDQLHRFEKFRELFLDVRMVLVLPERSPETFRLAHNLYPRYITFRDANLDDLAAVVDRMHRKLQPCTVGMDLRF